MANYATLKAAIQQVIKTNGNNEITGALLQQSLLTMINSLGVGYQYSGIATPSTNPGTPDQNVFYIASTAGTYSNFGGIVLADGEIAILKYNGAWVKDSTGAASLEMVNQLGQKIDLGDNTHIGTFVPAFEENNYAVTVTTVIKPTIVIPGQRIRVYVKSQTLSRFAVYAYPATSPTLIIKEFPSGTDFSNGILFDFVCPAEMEKDEYGNAKILFRTWAAVTLDKFDCWRLEPNNSSNFDELQKSLEEDGFLLGGTIDLQPTKVDGKFINNAGEEIDNANFSHTDPFFVPSGTELKVTATGYSNVVAIIALYNESDGTYVALVNCIDGTQREYTYVATGDCFLVVSYDNRQYISINATSPNIYKRFGGTDQLVGVPTLVNADIVTGKFINNAGEEQDNSNFSHTVPFAVTAGTKIKVTAAGYLSTVAIISNYDSDLNAYNVLVLSDGSSVQDYEYVAPVAMNIVICFRSSSGYMHSISIEPTPIINSIPELSKQKGGINILAEFDNIVCVGDSLTYSQVMTQATSANSRQAKRPYPEVLANLCGNDYTILASPGYNSTQWWNTFADQIVAKENPIAIIYLGTNNGLSDTLDTDVVGDNPDNWADNYTGNYCRIVNKFKGLGYRILLLKIWYTNAGGVRDLPHTNSAIGHIGERFGCAVMDVPRTIDLQYKYWPNLQGSDFVHYNDLGYAWFASKLIENSGMLPTEQMKFLIPQ